MKKFSFMGNCMGKNLLAVGLIMSGVMAFSSAAAGSDMKTLHGHVPAIVSQSHDTGRLPAATTLNLSIGLPLRNREALTNLLQQIYDPSSPNFHHYLTPEQFTARFGPTEQDYEAVVNFAHAHGLTVTARHPNRLVVSVRGTVGNIERAFDVSLDEYQHPTENRTFRAPNTDPSLDLDVPVMSIGGLDNYLIPKPALKPLATDNVNSLPTSNAGGIQTNKPAPAAGSGPSGAYYGKDFRAAYAPGVTQTGTGQSVGLLEFESGFYQSDITAFETAAG